MRTEVLQQHLVDSGQVARILLGEEGYYAVETAACDDAGQVCGEWFLTDSGPGAPSSAQFETEKAARAFVALIDAGSDYHVALAFVLDNCKGDTCAACGAVVGCTCGWYCVPCFTLR